MGVDGDITTSNVHYAAALCAQLPRESRVAAAVDSRARWDDNTYLLHRIEYTLRRVFWDGKAPEPEPLPIPGDIEGAQAAAVKEENAQMAVAALLGLGGD